MEQVDTGEEVAAERVTEWWKTLAVALAAIVVSLASAYFVLGREAVSRAEVHDIVNQTSPYALERSGVLAQLQENRRLIVGLRADVLELQHEHEQEVRQLARLSVLLEAFLRRNP